MKKLSILFLTTLTLIPTFGYAMEGQGQKRKRDEHTALNYVSSQKRQRLLKKEEASSQEDKAISILSSLSTHRFDTILPYLLLILQLQHENFKRQLSKK